MNTLTPYYTLPRKYFILVVLLLTPSLKVWGQTGIIVVSNPQLPAVELMSQIEDQTKYRFAYVNTLFDKETIVTLPSVKLSVEDALEALTTQIAVKYLLAGKYITFVKREPRRQPGKAYRTNDRYHPTNIKDVSAEPYPRPLLVTGDSVTISTTDESVEISTPAFYSTYRNPNLYDQIQGSIPKWAMKTNLLYAGISLTPNLSAELGTGPRTSVELTGSYNPWNWEGGWEDNKKKVHYMLRVEYRWWMCERFNGHYIGPHVFYNNYNVGQTKIPTLFKKDYQYEGWAVGAGVSYGYNLPLANRWGLEFTAGFGGAYLKQSQYRCGKCGEPADKERKWYFGPTRLGVNLVFMFK